MIKELRVEHWKSFDRGTLYIDPVTILIGANASGKSNLLEAFVFLQRVGEGADIDEAINGSRILPAIRGGTAAICRRGQAWFALDVVVGTDGMPDCRYRIKVWTDGLAVTAFEEELLRMDATAGGEDKRLLWTERFGVGPADDLSPKAIIDPVLGPVEHHEHVRGQMLSVHWLSETGEARVMAGVGVSRSYLRLLPESASSPTFAPQERVFDIAPDVLEATHQVRTALEGIFVFDPIPSRMRAPAALSTRLELDGSNLAGVLAALGEAAREDLERHLIRHVSQLPERDLRRIWAQTIGVLGRDAMLYCTEGWNDASDPPIDARTMSDGTLRYIAIIAVMLLRPSGSLLVIEDVDTGLHPSRASLLMNALRELGKERGIDVLVTTHTPALLDAAGLGMLPFIMVAHRDSASGASVLTPLEDIEQLPKLLAGGSLGQLVTAGDIQAAVAAGAP